MNTQAAGADLDLVIHSVVRNLFDTNLNGSPDGPVLPSQEALSKARSTLTPDLPITGLGLQETLRHLQQDISPGLNLSSLSPRYFGFVIGGTTPAAAVADAFVTAYDQNVHVHLPRETISTDVEDRALRMLLELVDLNPDKWGGRTFTTGATASNVVGLACAREGIVTQALRRKGIEDLSPSKDGLLAACRAAGIDDIKILSSMPHSSLRKAASIVGLGNTTSCISVNDPTKPWKLDISKLERCLEEASAKHASCIVAISCGEVNTGRFATDDRSEMEAIRALCDHHTAWLHVDGAFGLFAGTLPPSDEFDLVRRGIKGVHLADSIAGDGHKLLNVPYDCGFFFTRHLDIQQHTFGNPGAAYLSVDVTNIPSPLNMGIENSRRFRALPVYASLAAYGLDGYREMLVRQVRFARAVAKFLKRHPGYELLPRSESGSVEEDEEELMEDIYIVVLFRARDEAVNARLVQRINATGKMYVSGTQWEGKPAARIAVSNWRIEEKGNIEIVNGVLDEIVREGV